MVLVIGIMFAAPAPQAEAQGSPVAGCMPSLQIVLANGNDAKVSEDGCYVYHTDFIDVVHYYPEKSVILAYGDQAHRWFSDINHPEKNKIRTDCPKDIVVPSQIDGAEIKGITSSAFYNTGLISVRISEGIKYIAPHAFAYNQIEDLKLPNSLTTIDSWAFEANKLTQVEIPAGLQKLEAWAFRLQNPLGGSGYDSIDTSAGLCYQLSFTPQKRIDMINSSWFVNLTLADPANPNNISADTLLYKESETDYFSELGSSYDVNQDGDTDDTFSMGGHLINAGSITVNYLSETNKELKKSVTLTGELEDGTVLQDYLANGWQQWPAIDNPYDLTPEQQAQIQAILDRYWVVGQQVTVTVPDILAILRQLPPPELSTSLLVKL